jgi:hypothetical protein
LDIRVFGRIAHLGVAEQFGEDADAGLDLALLLLGGVVATVLLQVTLITSRLDLLGDLGAAFAGEVLQLGSATFEGLGGQPGFGELLRHSALLKGTGCAFVRFGPRIVQTQDKQMRPAHWPISNRISQSRSASTGRSSL